MAEKVKKEYEEYIPSTKETSSGADGATRQESTLRGVDSQTINKMNSGYTPSAKVTEANNYLDTLRKNGYKSNYTAQLDSLIDSYVNRGQFDYDIGGDVLFDIAKRSAMRQGRVAMADTVAQASSLTGGYGNSYGATAGAAAYNKHLEELNASAPDYYGAAYDAYLAERNAELQSIGLLQGEDDRAYARWADEYAREASYANELYAREYGQWADERAAAQSLASMQNADWWANREFEYGAERDKVADERYDAEWQHQLDREAVSDRRYDAEWQYQKDRDAISDTRYDNEWQYQLGRDKVSDDRYDAALQYQKDRDEIADEQWEKSFEEEQRQYNKNMWFNQSQLEFDNVRAENAELRSELEEREQAERELEDDYIEARNDPKTRTFIESWGDSDGDVGEAIKSAYDSGEFGSGEKARTIVEVLFDHYEYTDEQIDEIMGEEWFNG